MTTPERDIQPMRADRLRDHILGLLLPTTSELVVASRLTPQQVKDDIHDYLEAGFLDSAEIGCLLPGVPVFWPTASGLDRLEASEAQRTWFSPEALANLLYFDLPKLESVRDISRVCSTDEQPLSAIQFYEGSPDVRCGRAPSARRYSNLRRLCLGISDGQGAGPVSPARVLARRDEIPTRGSRWHLLPWPGLHSGSR